MKNLLLVIDIGNTNTVCGVYDEKKLLYHWRIGSVKDRTADEYGILIKELLGLNDILLKEITNIAISCVVPPLNPVLKKMGQKIFTVDPFFVDKTITTGMPILYDNKSEVGADRIVNAVAAYEMFKKALIIVDFGTAITFDVVSEKGEYLGGAIYPGISIAVDALFQRTAILPKVEVMKPRSVIGKTTVESIQSGIVYGTSSLVDGLVRKIKDEMKTEYKVVATGGMAEIIANQSQTIEEVLPFLTLEGLKILFYKNKG